MASLLFEAIVMLGNFHQGATGKRTLISSCDSLCLNTEAYLISSLCNGLNSAYCILWYCVWLGTKCWSGKVLWLFIDG